jgi:hypothetical protein
MLGRPFGKPTRLPAEAFNQLRAIAKKEIKESMTEGETEKMGINILRLFDLPVVPDSAPPVNEVAEQEFKALKYLHCVIYHGEKSPSVRGITAGVGLRSARSGFRFLNRLIGRGFVYRDDRKEVFSIFQAS